MADQALRLCEMCAATVTRPFAHPPPGPLTVIDSLVNSGLMNGSNHLEEAEDRPFAICPIDVKKWHLALTAAELGPNVCTDLCAREEALLTIFMKHGLRADAARCRQRLAALQNKPIPHEPVLTRLRDLLERTRPELQKLAKLHGMHVGSSKAQLARELANLNEEGENVPANLCSES